MSLPFISTFLINIILPHRQPDQTTKSYSISKYAKRPKGGRKSTNHKNPSRQLVSSPTSIKNQNNCFRTPGQEHKASLHSHSGFPNWGTTPCWVKIQRETRVNCPHHSLEWCCQKESERMNGKRGGAGGSSLICLEYPNDSTERFA